MLLAPAAMAANDPKQVGKNFSELLKGWGKDAFIGIAAIVSVVFLINRRFGELAVFCLAAVLVGGFVLAPDTVIGFIKGIWTDLAG